MKRIPVLLLLSLAPASCLAQTVYTGTLPASSGQVVFTLTSDRPVLGPSVTCPIARNGQVSCAVPALTTPQQAYRICVQPAGIQPGICFFSQPYGHTDGQSQGARVDLSASMPAGVAPVNYAALLPQDCTLGAVCRSSLRPPGSGPVVAAGAGELGARLLALEQRLHTGQHATIAIDKPGTLSAAVTLERNVDLLIQAPVTVAANVSLAGMNRISCTPAGILTFAPGASFVGVGDDLAIEGCAARAEPISAQQLFATKSSSHVLLARNSLQDVGLMHIDGGSDYALTDNSVTFTRPAGPAAFWGGVSQVQVVRNHFVGGGTEYFNRDSDPAHGGPTTLPPIAASGGHYLIAENTCIVAGACFWGSTAHDVYMLNNYAADCGDVCFDFEGSIHSAAIGNRGNEAATALGAVFFTSDHILFQGNLFTNSRASLIRVFNSSRAPAQSRFLTIDDNLLECTGPVCAGLGGDPNGDLAITGNHFLNARLDLGTFGGNTTIRGNDLLFTEAATAAFTAIQLPDLLNGTSLLLADNQIRGTPAQPAGSTCIGSTSSDFNSSIRLEITANTCHANLAQDLVTANTGGNPGTSVTTVVSGNHWQYGRTPHTHPGANHDIYTQTPAH